MPLIGPPLRDHEFLEGRTHDFSYPQSQPGVHKEGFHGQKLGLQKEGRLGSCGCVYLLAP